MNLNFTPEEIKTLLDALSARENELVKAHTIYRDAETRATCQRHLDECESIRKKVRAAPRANSRKA